MSAQPCTLQTWPAERHEGNLYDVLTTFTAVGSAGLIICNHSCTETAGLRLQIVLRVPSRSQPHSTRPQSVDLCWRFHVPDSSVQHVSDSVELHPAGYVSPVGFEWDPIYPRECVTEHVVLCAL